MTFRSTFNTQRVFSCIFRHHRLLPPHNQINGHLVGFSFTFEADQLDDSRRCIDSDALSVLRKELGKWYDGTLIITKDDPRREQLYAMHALDVARVVELDYVGDTAFAKHAWTLARDFLRITGLEWRVRCVSVECEQNGGLSTYIPSPTTN